MVGCLNGLMFALVVGIVAVVWYGNWRLALIIGFAMVINLIVSAASGVVIPPLFQRLKIDPALASGVALTTITDVIGFLSVLGLAALLLL